MVTSRSQDMSMCLALGVINEAVPIDFDERLQSEWQLSFTA